MGFENKSSILTNTQRSWLRETEDVTHENKTRERAQQRVRAAIATDSGLLAEALEDGRLNADTVGTALDFAELGDGISALVAALYRIADESGLDGERTIQKGIKRGKKGRIARIEEKLKDEGAKSLTLGEVMDLRDAESRGENPELEAREGDPEVVDRLNRALDQDMSDLSHGFGPLEEVSEAFEED